jgi:hypothetical protein
MNHLVKIIIINDNPFEEILKYYTVIHRLKENPEILKQYVTHINKVPRTRNWLLRGYSFRSAPYEAYSMKEIKYFIKNMHPDFNNKKVKLSDVMRIKINIGTDDTYNILRFSDLNNQNVMQEIEEYKKNILTELSSNYGLTEEQIQKENEQIQKKINAANESLKKAYKTRDEYPYPGSHAYPIPIPPYYMPDYTGGKNRKTKSRKSKKSSPKRKRRTNRRR